MAEKEFKTLSEKIENYYNYENQKTGFVYTEDIKEFIKIIEEILNRKVDYTTSRKRDLQRRLHQIKERAGPKLITK